MDNVVEIKNLSIHSEQACIVEKLSLSLGWDKPITILGETGSGKSLLAHAIMGALPENLRMDGDITLFGRSQLTRLELESCWGKQIAMLPQEPWLSLDPIMLVRKQLSLVHRCVNFLSKPNAQSLAQQSLSEFDLTVGSDKVPSQLSGGMAQRVAYLCATAAGGRVLIADEPTKGLDANRKKHLIRLLKKHSEQGALLTITHDIDVAAALGGDVIVMRQGKIVERGQCEHLLAQPKSEYAKQLIAAHNETYTQLIKPHRDDDTLVSLRDVSKHCGGQSLFHRLSFSIQKGEIVGICGDSGAGKSTLADMILGLTPIDQGQILYHENIFENAKALKLYQDPPAAFSTSMTLAQNLDDLCRLHCLDRDVIEGFMTELKLDKQLLARTPVQISGGELQRFAILRVLLMKPKLLVADEPTSRLDPIVSASTMKLLIQQAQRINCAVLLISHDPKMVHNVCNKVINIK
ncbi:ATP-binding cassette domain-containing protein [Vibrio sp. FNV 38]|nr:ATP-binding cassette domain-containing protein [Vibrio sp. FNV 38]